MNRKKQYETHLKYHYLMTNIANLLTPRGVNVVPSITKPDNLDFSKSYRE